MNNKISILPFILNSAIDNFPGDYGEGEPPVPIPNTAVKPLCADGTCRVTGWESKSLPGVILKRKFREYRGFLF